MFLKFLFTRLLLAFAYYLHFASFYNNFTLKES